MTSLLSTSQMGTDDMPSDYEELLNLVDLAERAMRNPKLSAAYFRLFLSLVHTYPQILHGDRVPVEVWRIQENGASKKQVTTNFFNDMNAIGAFIYESVFRREANERESFVTATPNTPFPETFDVMSVDRKRRAKEAEEKRRNQFKDPRQMLQCPECGSNHILWDATPRCENCHTVYPTVKDIPAENIVIEAEIIELADDPFLDEPTLKVPVVRAPVMVQQELPPLPPAYKDLTDLARPNEPCLKCGRPRWECWENSEGSWWYSCSDELQRAYARAKAR